MALLTRRRRGDDGRRRDSAKPVYRAVSYGITDSSNVAITANVMFFIACGRNAYCLVIRTRSNIVIERLAVIETDVNE